jgi:type III pantothenate kinase
MKLLIDAGNTRLKWALVADEQQADAQSLPVVAAPWLAQGWLHYDDLADWWTQLCQIAQAEGRMIRSIVAANVAGETVLSQVTAALLPTGVKIQWCSAQRQQFGIQNQYANVAEQGADRWLAVVGARLFHQGDVVLVLAGTALTVEALTQDNLYLGGSILPGRALMYQALRQGTASLLRPQGEFEAFPSNTANALETGLFDAQIGAILAMQARLAAHTGRALAPILLTGGDAPALCSALKSHGKVIDALVLYGLWRVSCL